MPRPATDLKDRYRWLILGGGIHGVHLAARLVGDAGVPSHEIAIVDPNRDLLSRWRTCTAITGMTHLRSPSVHHLDLSSWSLDRFAGGKRRRRKPGLFASPYARPKLTLFNAHCDKVIEEYGLGELHVRGRAIDCDARNDHVHVRMSDGSTTHTCNLILAIGATEAPAWPAWAPRDDGRIQHIFDSDFSGLPQVNKETVAVVGGGISAAQTALALVRSGTPVHLISRHPLRQHQFDSDPGWLGPKFMLGFSKEQCHERRRMIISEARNAGSVPPDVRRAIRRAIEHEELGWHQTTIEALRPSDRGLELHLSNKRTLNVQRIVLATGFEKKRPGGDMIDRLIDSAELRVAPCGYPIVDTALRWHPRIYVSGPLAELELGPVARNIAGARRAGTRIVQALTGKTSRARPAS